MSDETPHSAASHLGVHCLLRHVCPNTYGEYGIKPSHGKTCIYITQTSLFKYIVSFTTKKGKFSDKKFDVFHISAQNIDCGYSLELPQRGGSNEYQESMFLSRNKKNNIYS